MAVATAGLIISTSGFAYAQTRPVSGNDATLNPSAVSPQQGLKLEVTKQGTNPNDDPVPGQLPEGGIAGITFVLHKAEGFDVTTQQGRDDARRARTQEQWDRLARKEVAREVTNADGVAVFDNLAPGLYLLEETKPDAKRNYHTSAPKWLVLPFGDVYGKGFTYDNVMVVKPAPTTTPPPPPPVTTTVTTTITTTVTRPCPPTTPTTEPTEPTEPTTPETPTEPSTPESTPESTPPTTPAPSTTPATPAPPTTPANPPKDNPRPGLANTGANVLTLLALSALLIAAGAYLTRRNARNA